MGESSETYSNEEVLLMPKQYGAPPPMTIDPAKNYTATLHTTMGDIRVELLPGEAPKTVNNFVFWLVKVSTTTSNSTG